MHRAERRKRTFKVISHRLVQIKRISMYTGHNKIHSFKKTNPFDCGRPRCWLCSNPRRTWKTDTRQEQIAELSAKEQVYQLFKENNK